MAFLFCLKGFKQRAKAGTYAGIQVSLVFGRNIQFCNKTALYAFRSRMNILGETQYGCMPVLEGNQGLHSGVP